MPIEDVDSNIRRNLVAVATIVLISTYLDVPIVALAFDRLLDLPKPIPPNKLIALGYALLGYFSLRLAVNEVSADETRKRRDHAWGERMWRALRWLQRDAARFERTHKERGAFRGKLANLVASLAKARGVDDPYQTLRVGVRQPEKPMRSWEARFSIDISWESTRSDPRVRIGDAGSLLLRVPFPRRVSIAVIVWARRTFYTADGLQVEFPALLCLAAQGALAYQLWRLL